MKASIAIQILPDGVEEEKKIRIIDDCIEHIKKKGLHYVVCPFETVVEGDSVEELIDLVKDLQEIGIKEGAKTLATYVKLWYSPNGVMTIDEKTKKHQH